MTELEERIAQITAHRACCGTEHDPANGKFHGYCVVCGVPFPCAYVGNPTSNSEAILTSRILSFASEEIPPTIEVDSELYEDLTEEGYEGA